MRVITVGVILPLQASHTVVNQLFGVSRPLVVLRHGGVPERLRHEARPGCVETVVHAVTAVINIRLAPGINGGSSGRSRNLKGAGVGSVNGLVHGLCLDIKGLESSHKKQLHRLLACEALLYSLPARLDHQALAGVGEVCGFARVTADRRKAARHLMPPLPGSD